MRKFIVGSARICFTLFVVILAGYFISAAVAVAFSDYVTSTGIENFQQQMSDFFGF